MGCRVRFLAVPEFGFMIHGLELRGQGLGIGLQGLGFGVWGAGLRVEGLRFGV